MGYPGLAEASASAGGAGPARGAAESLRGRSPPRWHREQLSHGDGKMRKSAKLEAAGEKLSLCVFPEPTQAQSRALALCAAPLCALPVQCLIFS